MSLRIKILREQPYFSVLPDADLEYLAEQLIERRFAKGENVFLEGDPCDGLYIVCEGQVRIFKLSADGREQVLTYCAGRQSFNEVAVFDGGPNPAHVIAAAPSIIWTVPRELIFDMLRTRPTMANAIIQNFAHRLRHLVGLVEDLSLRHVTARLAKLLVEAASGELDVHAMTQQELAARLGTVREMVARSLKLMETRGLIRLERGRIVILDRQTLEKMV
ncbi:MAG: Crp/Fnr family transcriptional regulator [Chloroflexi bacterium]|nr:Crp/Fnr family transcriptional regulator [Chloroflexota bacterium]